MPRVLVIEDNAASLDLLVYLLTAFGHSALTARDGLEGIDVARRELPDLILCDIQLPGADGIEVCRQLKKTATTKDIPLLAVTAYAMVGDREKLLKKGFNGYLSKPIDPQLFMQHLTPFLGVHQASHSEQQHVKKAATAGAVFSGTLLIVDNSAVNIELSRSMLEPYGYKITAATSVDEALQLLKDFVPDVICSDLHMPNKNGFDFIELAKAEEKLRRIPFIFITSTLWADHERERALSLGAAQFIVRPIDPPSLIAQIEACRSTTKEHA